MPRISQRKSGACGFTIFRISGNLNAENGIQTSVILLAIKTKIAAKRITFKTQASLKDTGSVISFGVHIASEITHPNMSNSDMLKYTVNCPYSNLRDAAGAISLNN